MAKFFGKIGYAISKDVRPGVWDGEITEFSRNAVCRVHGSEVEDFQC